MTDVLETLNAVTGKILRYQPRLQERKELTAPSMVRKPRLLDLFCCAGGAGVGYSQAGFEVVGVDIKLQRNYPLPFIQADALALDPKFISLFDAVHASPPCQAYSDLAKRNGNADEWPHLIEPVRDMLIRSGIPYVIENVDGAPLLNPVVLCGTMFPELRVLRHRLFEANFEIVPPASASAEIGDMTPQLDLYFGRLAGNRDSSGSLLLAA
jgi:DNA (cytosine-5)-methyltransferase 1